LLPTTSNQLEIAITIDDLPYQTKKGGKPIDSDPAIWKDTNQRILKALANAEAPATIFVNCGNLATDDTLVAQWRAAGHSIGNHTANHRSAAHGPLADWIEDLRQCDNLWAKDSKERKWFRFPYLWRGETMKRRDQVSKSLSSAGYITAPVTVDSHDWLFEFYRRKSVKKSKSETWEATLGERYVSNVAEAIAEARQISKEKLGREAPQILLIHLNHTNSEYLPQILTNIKKAGLRIVPLEKVITDPLYQLPDAWAGRGARWWFSRTVPLKRKNGKPWYRNREGNLRKELKQLLLSP